MEKILLWTAFWTLLPVSELRGGLPYALLNGINPVFAYCYCVFLNALLGPLIYLFLSSFHKLFSLMQWYSRLFDRFVERARIKIQSKIDKYGYLGVMLFVAIPLPVTGAVTGTLGAWVLGLDARKTCLAVLGGVMISGFIVTAIVLTGAEAFSFFIKNVH